MGSRAKVRYFSSDRKIPSQNSLLVTKKFDWVLCDGDKQVFAETPKGPPRQSVGLCPRANDARLFFSFLFRLIRRAWFSSVSPCKKHPERVPFAWWTETIQIRTLYSNFRKSGSALSLICLKNCNLILKFVDRHFLHDRCLQKSILFEPS